MSDPFERGFRYTTPSGKHMYNWRDAEDAASKGRLPEPPDYSAKTHEPYRLLINSCEKLARAGDLRGLQDLQICPARKELSSTPRSLKRWRDLCVRALSLRTGAGDSPTPFTSLSPQNRIVTNPKVMLGKPVIRGTRITVELILRKLGDGASQDKLLEAYPHLTRGDIQAAITYAADTLAHEEMLVVESNA
jgi:uncharacterized protein (DUF433 family)